MKKMLIIGCGSLVGSRFAQMFTDQEFYCAGGALDAKNTHPKSFKEMDITNFDTVKKVISSFPGKYVINFAGATLVDEIEKSRSQAENSLAYKVNVLGTHNLVESCQETGKFPILISSGFVFDGKSGPYSEEDPIAQNPQDVSWYAWTKILAERQVLSSGIDYLMIRISYPYRSEYREKSDFARNFLKLYDGVKSGIKEWYPIFTDQILTPTLIDDLPKAVLILLKKNATGIYHLTSPLTCSPFEFCCEILKKARGVKNPASLVPQGSLIQFQKLHPEIAKRPVRGGEKSDKIQQLGFTPTSWKEGISKAFGNGIT